jgi:hypothetical protein
VTCTSDRDYRIHVNFERKNPSTGFWEQVNYAYGSTDTSAAGTNITATTAWVTCKGTYRTQTTVYTPGATRPTHVVLSNPRSC